MSTSILATKLYIPALRPKVVHRAHLLAQLNEGLHRSLTLVSAPAGFGKTTLVSEWVAGRGQAVAWLSLDEDDSVSSRFLAYLIVALQKIEPKIGQGLLGVLQSLQPPSMKSVLTALLNEISALPYDFVVVLDDYHVIDSESVDKMLSFLLNHQPPQLHLVIISRKVPRLPLARLRARSQLIELRASDLRFTAPETADFLNRVMGLALSEENIRALETRTEGWIAGLQLAVISMQGAKDAARFIHSFTGSHHFVLDYLVQEVLQQQPESVQTFLLHTSILNRLCAPLCDAVLRDPAISGQETLAYIEQANLFIIPLDDERKWYRYHHLFADLLRQRLEQKTTSSTGSGLLCADELHRRASIWFEANGLELEAFQHAAAANDIDRAEGLIDNRGVPLHESAAVAMMLDWLQSLPTSVLDARPSLWALYGALLLSNGQTTGVEEKLQAAETGLQNAVLDDKTRNLIGQIAAARATLALTQYKFETIFVQARRALEYLHPDNLPYRFFALWTLGNAYFFQGDRAAATRTFTEGVAVSQASGDTFSIILALTGLGQLQELENQLYLAAETNRRVLQLLGEHPQPNANDAYLGLARIHYEWNDLASAEQYGRQSLHLAQQYDAVIDRFIISEIFLARLKLAQGDIAGAAAILTNASQSAHQHNFLQRMPEIAAAQVLLFLHQRNLTAAVRLAQTHELPISQARVYLAQGNISKAITVLESFCHQMKAKGWKDEYLRATVLQAIASYAHGENQKAIQLAHEALTLAEPGGFIRVFVDEGLLMKQLLSDVVAQGIMPEYVNRLLVAFEMEVQNPESGLPFAQPLSERELEVLRLVAEGLSNREISERLFIALVTVKVHNGKIFEKLQVQRRTEAVARARELGLL